MSFVRRSRTYLAQFWPQCWAFSQASHLSSESSNFASSHLPWARLKRRNAIPNDYYSCALVTQAFEGESGLTVPEVKPVDRSKWFVALIEDKSHAFFLTNMAKTTF
ncbi:uncharacterized protein LACBIDRAFT_333837 [Laccaria bicolor S238N-H82]|uniref:Predicted protein n=1 Tax=Laccaria bicolor (strain S238N-H82 / ATCC MYA-4686) TaxID=486041 RepID=B0DX85_LACBS|nr:uncharacterized protein LACBIDRAFT_333837 [Laccaria bicolor S238N-H82]EDR00792.1 predicted protein [Laccaria bicolor S238N-H82]|eukprot:XP_001888584.1 predicted protein [Laccaria bicolor S238N-H82]